MTEGAGGGAGQVGLKPECSESLKTFGEVLKAFRKRAGLTQEEFAPMVRYSLPTVASIEQGRRFPPPALVNRSEEVLDGFGALHGAARHLSRNPGLASWFRHWAWLEAQAISLYTYECRLIPGLLQTEEYARALFANQLPPLDDAQIEAQWEARAERQRILSERPNCAFAFILEEQLFLRRTGGREVMVRQVDKVLDLAEQRNVEVQVMPLVREQHAGLDGPMQLLEMPEHRWFAYCEGQESSTFLQDAKTVSTLHMRYARMRSQAYSLEDSKSQLERIRGAL